MNLNAIFGSVKMDYGTPQKLFDDLDAEFMFTVDVAASPANAKCERFYTEQDDGLSKSWAGEVVFCNPPYGRELPKWVKKAKEESANATIVMLIPARTDSTYWHEYIFGGGAEVRFLRGRLSFEGSTNKAPFPSAVVIFRRKNEP